MDKVIMYQRGQRQYGTGGIAPGISYKLCLPYLLLVYFGQAVS